MYFDENSPKIRRRNMGFRYGISGGIIMVVIHLFLLLLFQGTNRGDLLALFLSWFVYFMVGRMAAQAQYNIQREDLQPLRGVGEAGRGASMVACVFIWGFIVVRGIFRDALGVFIIVNPVGLFVAMLVDFIIAMGIGGWAGKTILDKYRVNERW